jgi:hypothetical protein
MKVFISYSTEDKDFVNRLATDLRTRAGIDAWLDQWEINPGDKIPEKIETGLSEANVFLLVLSPESVSSHWVEYERQAWLMMQIDEEKVAQKEGRTPARRLIPVLYKECQKPAFLQPINHVKIYDEDYDSGFNLLVNAILGVSEKPPIVPKPPIAKIPESGVPLRKYLLTLLKSIIPPMFEEVVFLYEMPRSYLLTNVTQVEKAISLIDYAISQEGENPYRLLECIHSVVPHHGKARL